VINPEAEKRNKRPIPPKGGDSDDCFNEPNRTIVSDHSDHSDHFKREGQKPAPPPPIRFGREKRHRPATFSRLWRWVTNPKAHCNMLKRRLLAPTVSEVSA